MLFILFCNTEEDSQVIISGQHVSGLVALNDYTLEQIIEYIPFQGSRCWARLSQVNKKFHDLLKKQDPPHIKQLNNIYKGIPKIRKA